MAPKDSHRWTTDQTRNLIRFRMANEDMFLKSPYSAKTQWERFVLDNGLTGKVNAQQASKKWENLKRKYKELVKSGSGPDAGEQTAGNWQYFEDMHEVLGSVSPIDLPVVVVSIKEEEQTAMLMETVEPSTSGECYAAVPKSELPQSPPNSAAAAASVSRGPPPATPSPRKRKRKSNDLLDFLKEESAKEQKRHEESEAKTDRLLELFEKMVEKM